MRSDPGDACGDVYLKKLMMTPPFVRRPTAVLTLVAPPASVPFGPAVRRRVRLCEVRLDRFDEAKWAETAAAAEREFPAAARIATIRLRADGGSWPDDRPRVEALRRALSLSAWRYVDLEAGHPEFASLAAVVAEVSPTTDLVVSRHDFAPVGPDALREALRGVREAALEAGAAVAKWAGNLLDAQACRRVLLDFAVEFRTCRPQLAVFAMGEESRATRVAAPLLCGGWSYAHDGTGPAAPGQIAFPVLEALLGSLPGSDAPDDSWAASVEHAVEIATREEA